MRNSIFISIIILLLTIFTFSSEGFTNNNMNYQSKTEISHMLTFRYVDWCNLQHPPSTTTSVGTPTENIYGQVYIAGVTDLSPEENTSIIAECGYGDDGTDPSYDASWTWVTATFNEFFVDPNNDEYYATLTVNTAGSYDYCFRFTFDGYTEYGDRDGSMNGYDTSQAGSLTVTNGSSEFKPLTAILLTVAIILPSAIIIKKQRN